MQQPTIAPSGSPSLATFRGVASSADYNADLRAAYSDLAVAYQQLQVAQNAALFSNEVLAVQNAAYQAAISALKVQLNGLIGTIQSLKTLASGVVGGSVTMSRSLYLETPLWGGFPSYYPATDPLPEVSQASYNPSFGQLTPALLNTTSKTFISDILTGQAIFPPNVITTGSMQVVPSVTPFAVNENLIQNAVDGDDSTYWRRNVYFSPNQNISSVRLTVVVSLPVQYVNSLLSNYITVIPYPEFGLDVTSVIVNGLPGSPSQQILPTDTAGNIVPLNATGRFRLFFPEQQVSSVEITFSQSRSNTILIPGLQCFSLGASTIDVGYCNFALSTPAYGSSTVGGASRALVPFTLNSNYFKSVSSVGPVIPGVSYNLYALSSPLLTANLNTVQDLQPITIGQLLPIFVDTIYVEVVFQPTTSTLPVVTEIDLGFVPIYLNA
jgi:hypothetical protein